MMHGRLAQKLAFGLILALASAQNPDVIDVSVTPITIINLPGSRADPNFIQQRALPLRLQDGNLSTNQIFEVQGARLGSGQTNEFAGQLTGVPGDLSRDQAYQSEDILFRPFCFEDADCDSGNCQVVGPLAPNDPDRQSLLVQGVEGVFYCGPPGEGNSIQETCTAFAARQANQPNQVNAATTPDQFAFQRVDGICTNVEPDQELWGSNQELQMRKFTGVPLDIEEERSAAPESISPRTITDLVNDEPGDITNQFGTSTLLAYCGQFIDHDLTLIEFQPPETRITIGGSPPTDPEIVFELSVLSPGSFPVLNPNSATPMIDLSMVYGQTESTAYSLRKPDYLAVLDFSIVEIQGEPQMFLPLASQIQGDLSMPPINEPGNFTRFVPTAMHPAVANLFAAGDLRANEQVMLISWHTLFVREHNRLVNQDLADLPITCDITTPQDNLNMIIPDGCELLYQLARRVNIAQWQQIVFVEYFSTWHEDNPEERNGPNNIVAQYVDRQQQTGVGFDSEVNPDIDILFSTAAYRFGHTIVRTYVVETGPEADDQQRSVFLGNAFFNTQEVTRPDRFGTSGFLLGASQQCGSSLDQFISTGIRNFLFGNIPGSEFRNSDLMAFNIERCRDHNCPTYNDIQRYYGYDEVTSYEELVSRNADPNFEIPECYINDLENVFGEEGEDPNVNVIDNVDPMVAMLIEPATIGQMGLTMFTVIREQFVRSMVGDSYFFLDQDGPALAQIQAAGFTIDDITSTGISDVLNRNSFNGAEVVVDLLTGATQSVPQGTQDVFDASPFIARTNGEGECCVNDGESAPTPVCFRNSTNPYAFYVENVSRCEALLALEAQGASFGQSGGFIAGTMLPITFTTYNCQCKRYVDNDVTITATLVTQSLSANEISSTLLNDLATLTAQPMQGVGGLAQRAEVNVIPTTADVTQVSMVIRASPDPDSFSDGSIMFGDMMNYGNMAPGATQILNSQNVISLECSGCQALPSDFIQEANAATQEAQLLGLPLAVGGAIIGGIALVVLIIVGCGARMYMNKRSQQQMFTSGQESV